MDKNESLFRESYKTFPTFVEVLVLLRYPYYPYNNRYNAMLIE